MQEHPIQGLLSTAMENLKSMTEVNTIIGDPIESPDGSFIIPVSKLGFGFAAGGSEFQGGSEGESDSKPFGGGSGGGVSITPIAFLIISKKGIKMVHLDQHTHLYEKMLNNTPQILEKVQKMLKESGVGKGNGNKEAENEKKKGKKEQQQKEDASSGEEKDDESSNYDI